jgi:TfoX C-terminal domain
VVKNLRQISELSCLGPASEKMLATIDIHTREDLKNIGPVQAYLELEQHYIPKPCLNLLYAMTLALEDRPWSSLTKEERVNLIMEIEAYHDLQKQISKDNG